MKIIIKLLKILLGLVFICSASFKLISIDEFELYIFSHNFLNLNLSFVAARLVIGFEYFIGLMLIVNIYSKQIWFLSVTTLSIFTIYLFVMLANKTVGNCHCFGEALKMSPLESIIKNIILLLIFILIRKDNELHIKRRFILSVLFFIISFSLPAIISPPDFLFKSHYSKMALVNKDELNTIVFNDNFFIDCNKGKKILCFYSTSCRFCQLADKKVSTIVNSNKLDNNDFINVFLGNLDDLDSFNPENNEKFKSTFIPIKEFLSITEGKMPLIILIEDKCVVDMFGYRNIDENKIVEFLRKSS